MSDETKVLDGRAPGSCVCTGHPSEKRIHVQVYPQMYDSLAIEFNLRGWEARALAETLLLAAKDIA